MSIEQFLGSTNDEQIEKSITEVNESISDLEKIVDMRLSFAQSNALEEDEMQELLRKKSLLESENISENKLQLEKINKIISKSTVAVPTLLEYKILLEKTGLPHEQVIDLLSHENAHANKAESVGANVGGYTLLVWKGNSGYMYLPFALTAVNHELGEHLDNIEKEIAIANAPEEYGNATSPADRERIKTLRDSLMN